MTMHKAITNALRPKTRREFLKASGGAAVAATGVSTLAIGSVNAELPDPILDLIEKFEEAERDAAVESRKIRELITTMTQEEEAAYCLAKNERPAWDRRLNLLDHICDTRATTVNGAVAKLRISRRRGRAANSALADFEALIA